MLDINLFRVEKGHNPEIIRESQRRRGASIEVVDEVINLDKEWRKRYHIFRLSDMDPHLYLFCGWLCLCLS